MKIVLKKAELLRFSEHENLVHLVDLNYELIHYCMHRDTTWYHEKIIW